MARARLPLFVLTLVTLALTSLVLDARPASALDHFMCYKAKRSSSRICEPASPANTGGACADDADCGGNAGEKLLCVKNKFGGGQVLLTDPLESVVFNIGKPLSLCAPANKNGEDPAAPSKPDHLEGYQIKAAKVCSDNQLLCNNSSDCNAGAKCSGLKHSKTLVLIEDQLGRLVLETKKPDRLLVPAAKDLSSPTDPPAAPTVGELKCYAAVAKKKVCENDPTVKCKVDQDCEDAEVGGACNLGFPKGIHVVVEDQFQERLYELKKPTRYCPEASASYASGAPPPATSYVTCYQAKPAKGVCDSGSPENAGGACAKEDQCGGTKGVTAHCVLQPKHSAVTTIHVNSVLGAGLADTIKEEELCIPELQAEQQCDALVGPPVVGAAVADLNDDGIVDQADIEVLTDPAHFGKQMGEVGYIDGYDIAADTTTHPSLGPDAPDGVIDQADVDAVRLQCGANGVPTSPTTLSGFVFDTLSNALHGVSITGGQGGLVGSTLPDGSYDVVVGPSDVGLGEINFFGNSVIDPTPGGSGEYPTIPHKPIFLNGGVDNVFRTIYLPERDLTGAVTLDDSNSIPSGIPGARIATEPIVVDNTSIGASIQIPAGCTLIPPPGGTTQISIASLPSGNVPVPPPPGVNSSMFLTFQEGGAQVVCSSGSITTSMANVDLLPVGSGVHLYGVEDGAFQVVASCTVFDADTDSDPNDPDDVIVCSVPTPFQFAWYFFGPIIPPSPPCPLTLVAVEVLCNGVPAGPGVSVSIGGGAPACTTNTSSIAGFVDMPAGPDGQACFPNAFEYTAIANDGAGNIGIATATAVPGGVTAIDVEICSTVSGPAGDISQTAVDPVLFSIEPELYPYLLVETDFANDFPDEPTSSIDFTFYFDVGFGSLRQGPSPSGVPGGFPVVSTCSFPMSPGGVAFCDITDDFGVLPYPSETNAQMQWDFEGSASRFQFFIGIDVDTDTEGVDHNDIFGTNEVNFSWDVVVTRSGEPPLLDFFPNDGPVLIDVNDPFVQGDPTGDQIPLTE